MSSQSLNARVYRWFAALSLAAYGVVGVFGHSLHGLMPCSDGSCGNVAAADDHCCCGHHDRAPSKLVSGPATDGAEFGAAGHDEGDCSLCTLLAKIKVGRLTLHIADVRVEHSYRETIADSLLLPADLVLCGAPRGPPTV